MQSAFYHLNGISEENIMSRSSSILQSMDKISKAALILFSHKKSKYTELSQWQALFKVALKPE